MEQFEPIRQRRRMDDRARKSIRKRDDFTLREFRHPRCQRKRAYPTRKHALTVAAKSRWATGGEDIRAYHCPICSKWHLGHRSDTILSEYTPPHTLDGQYLD